MASRMYNLELNYGNGNANANGNTLILYDVRIKKDKSWCNLEYIYKHTPLQRLYNWLMCSARDSHSCQSTVNISSISMYQEIHHKITIIFIKMSFIKMLYPVNNYRYYNINRHRQSKNNASNYIKNLLVRNDLNRYFRASVNHIMLYSKSTSKGESNYSQARIMAYAEPLLKLARALYDGEIYFNAYKDLKVNYYSLNPKDLYDSLQIARDVANNASLELEDIDIEKTTLHEDISPLYSAINGKQGLILTFCILRGINGYEPSMGKTLIFPNITKGQTLEMIPQDDGDDYFDICIFLSDVVEHGSSIWNRNHPKVLEQFKKVKIGNGNGNGNINDEPWQPARMSITMLLYFETPNPKELWFDIQSKLKCSHC